MSNIAIKVENLSKAYRIGLKEGRADTLGGALASWARSPFQNFKKLRSLSRIDVTDPAPDIFWALRDLNFEVQHGEVLGIIGKNGAGKSTLLKILSQITEPTTGHIDIHGRVASLLEVGTGFNPELTGRENVYLNGTILGMTRREIDRKFDEIIDFSGVEKFMDTPVKRYSSGMKVRLAFAVAAHLDPEILIIDEVLAVGDAEFQKKCLGKIQEISHNEGRTVLFVSHNLAAVQNICNKGLLLSNGNISYSGEIENTLKKYNQPTKVIEKKESESISIIELKLNNTYNLEFKSDDFLKFDITIFSLEKHEGMSFFLTISNQEGVNILHLRKDDIQINKGENFIEIKIPSINVISGIYALRIKFLSFRNPLFHRYESDTYTLMCTNSINPYFSQGFLQFDTSLSINNTNLWQIK